MKKNVLPKIRGKVLFDEPLFKHTTFRIGGPCRIWVEPRDVEDLKEILKFANSKKKRFLVVGRGSNILFRDVGYNGIGIHLQEGYFNKVRFDGTRAITGAGVLLDHLIDLTCKKGLQGMEGLVGIPGTVGGAIFMNASYKQAISDCLEAVKVMDKKKRCIDILKKENLKFGYRHSNLDRYIILEAQFGLKKGDARTLLKRKREFLKARRKEQPLGYLSAGCIFKNPKAGMSAGRYIEMSGFKGRRVGDAEVSRVHANFIINLKEAKARDVLRLIDIIKKRVKSKFKVKLIPEIVMV